MYLINNQYIESHYQKDFMPDIWAYSRIELCHKSFKKTLTGCNHYLIDLKNAFGEVHYSLILSVLHYHHITDEINCIVEILYSDFCLPIIMNNFHTKYIAVEKGVLQGEHFDF